MKKKNLEWFTNRIKSKKTVSWLWRKPLKRVASKPESVKSNGNK